MANNTQTLHGISGDIQVKLDKASTR